MVKILQCVIYIFLFAWNILGQQLTAEYKDINPSPFAGLNKPAVIAILKFDGDGGFEKVLYEELRQSDFVRRNFEINSFETLDKNKTSFGINELNPSDPAILKKLKNELDIEAVVTGRYSSNSIELKLLRTSDSYLLFDFIYQNTSSSTALKDILKLFIENRSTKYIMQEAKLNNTLAATDLKQIEVVPNPYFFKDDQEAKLPSGQTSGRGERFIRFTHVPPGLKIRIFNLAGKLVKTLDETDLFQGDIRWDLRTEENLDADSGLYIYAVDAPGIGTKVGKFSLIK